MVPEGEYVQIVFGEETLPAKSGYDDFKLGPALFVFPDFGGLLNGPELWKALTPEVPMHEQGTGLEGYRLIIGQPLIHGLLLGG